MATVHTDDVLGRLHRLDRLVEAYGHILVASELERPLPSVIPLLTSEDLSDDEAGALVKDILRRGGAALVADLEEVERMIRGGKKDPAISAALRGVRFAFRQTAHLQAGALARKLGRAAQTGVPADPQAASLQKELEAFISGVAHAVREDEMEFEEVFADEDLLTDVEDTAAPGALAAAPAESPAAAGGSAYLPLYKEELQGQFGLAEGVDRHNGIGSEPLASNWNAGVSPEAGRNGESLTEFQSEDVAVDSEGDAAEPAEEERPLDWLRDRSDVYNEMLTRWGAGEAFVPQHTPLVRRGGLDPQRCADLYRELLAGGAAALVDRFEELASSPGHADDRLRYVRGRIAEGLTTALPRVLALLVSDAPLPPDWEDAPEGPQGVLAALSAYLGRAVDLFDDSSPSHARLRYLSSELRSAIAASR